MAYHITLITNNSKSSIAITNPAYEADSKLIGPGPGTAYVPDRPIEVNKISGNPDYLDAIGSALNLIRPPITTPSGTTPTAASTVSAKKAVRSPST